jgi:putative transposase
MKINCILTPRFSAEKGIAGGKDMPFVNVMIHAVWGTKNRFPFLTDNIRPAIHDHIKTNGLNKKIFMDTINGVEDHVHVLFGLNADLSLSKTLQLMKGEASHWINKNSLIDFHFEWADEYFAESVSRGYIQKVRNYIKNQVEHHRKKTFQDEVDEFLLKYNFRKFQG